MWNSCSVRSFSSSFTSLLLCTTTDSNENWEASAAAHWRSWSRCCWSMPTTKETEELGSIGAEFWPIPSALKFGSVNQTNEVGSKHTARKSPPGARFEQKSRPVVNSTTCKWQSHTYLFFGWRRKKHFCRNLFDSALYYMKYLLLPMM